MWLEWEEEQMNHGVGETSLKITICDLRHRKEDRSIILRWVIGRVRLGWNWLRFM
jgi:hypothetical protein